MPRDRRNPRVTLSELLGGISAPTLSDCVRFWTDSPQNPWAKTPLSTLDKRRGRRVQKRWPVWKGCNQSDFLERLNKPRKLRKPRKHIQKTTSKDWDRWEFLNHLTISRDRTANSNFVEEQLAVLIASPLNTHEGKSKDKLSTEPIEPAEQPVGDLHSLSYRYREELLNILDDYPTLALEGDDYELEEEETDDFDDEKDHSEEASELTRSISSTTNSDADFVKLVPFTDWLESDSSDISMTRVRAQSKIVMDSSSENESGDDTLILRKLLGQMENLRAENRRLKDRLEEAERKNPKIEEKLPPTFQVFHRLSSSEVSVYPPTRMAVRMPGEQVTDESVLRLDVTLASVDRYLGKHPEIVFAVFKDYQRRIKNDISESQGNNENQAESLAPLEPHKESIRLTSDEMKDAFKACMELWPDFSSTLFPNFDIDAEIPAPYMFWHHYQSTYASVALQLKPHHRDHMDRLTQWIQDQYSEEYSRANASFGKGLVSYKTMAYLVRPGDVLVSTDANGVLNGYLSTTWVQPRSYESAEDTRSKKSTDQVGDEAKGIKQTTIAKYNVECWAWEYNGSFRSYTRTISISLSYSEPGEEIDISSLNAYPLKYAKDSTKDFLRRRGEMYWSCRSQKLVEYQEIDPRSLATVIERYMVDYATYKKLHGQPEQGVLKSPGGLPTLAEDRPPQGDEIYVFPPKVTCYNLVRKSWVDLSIDRMYDVKWDKAAFENLVIDRDTKELISALVMNQLEAERATDIISGKGNGLIMLLHGGPGTGKTFTAEAVAEIAEKPLYRVTCGDVGTKPEDVERYLESVLHLGKIWGCVVLLDEADVFLEERTLSQLERNALVSVFLRVLEYYEGILILTSNRVGTFDEAFKSRIQLALHYKNLSDTQRRRIWWNFLTRLQNMERGDEPTTIDFDDLFDHIDELATKHVMNGRQIRNVITTARQLAKHRKKVMTFSDLHHVIEVSSRFDKYLQDVKEGLTDDEIARSYGKR